RSLGDRLRASLRRRRERGLCRLIEAVVRAVQDGDLTLEVLRDVGLLARRRVAAGPVGDRGEARVLRREPALRFLDAALLEQLVRFADGGRGLDPLHAAEHDGIELARVGRRVDELRRELARTPTVRTLDQILERELDVGDGLRA